MTMQVTIIGAGYVGLVSAACFAKLGHKVVCVDNNPQKIERLLKGEIPIYEPGLDRLVEAGLQAQSLRFTSDTASAVKGADIVLIAVGTPTAEQSGEVDLQYVYGVADDIAPHLKPGAVVVSKSTVPVGATRQIQQRIKKIKPNLEFAVASNPEFLREGAAIGDFLHPDRVVIGADSPATAAKVAQLYKRLADEGAAILTVSLESSEMIKYAANAFLATKISFINEIANMAEQCGANIADIAKGIGLDKRIGDRFLNPGPGFGGSCFPKDTLALAHTAETLGVNLSIVNAVIESNEARKKQMAEKVIAAMGAVNGRKIAVLGLAFKAETDDMRDAPSLDILEILDRQGAILSCYDPKAMDAAKAMMPYIQCQETMFDALKDADAALVITEWDEFRNLDLDQAKKLLKKPLLIDLRNIFDIDAVVAKGFRYVSIGRPEVKPPISLARAQNG